MFFTAFVLYILKTFSSVYSVSVYLFAIRSSREREKRKKKKEKNLTILTLMARKPKGGQWAYREWPPSGK